MALKFRDSLRMKIQCVAFKLGTGTSQSTEGNCPCQLDGCGLYREGGGIIARSPRVSFRRMEGGGRIWKEVFGFDFGNKVRSRIQNNKKIGFPFN